MILQAQEYEELEETPGRLQEFFDSTEGMHLHPYSRQDNIDPRDTTRGVSTQMNG
jgi:hypothetical protein